MSRIYRNNNQESTRLDGLALLTKLAIVGQAILLISAWLLPIVSEYSLIGDNISELVLGSYGFVQVIAFMVSGLGTLGLAFVVRKITIGARGSITCSLLVALNGAGTFLAAFFPTDKIDSPADLESLSTVGLIHIAIALVSFLAIIIGMFVLSWAFRKQAIWGWFSIGSVFFGAAALSLFFAQGQGPLVGLLQRLLVSLIAIWLVLLAFRANSIIKSATGKHDRSHPS